MRRDAWRGSIIVVLAAAAALASSAAVAEVSVGSPGSTRGLLQAGPGGQDPTPYPWAWIRHNLPAVQVLNPNGDDDGDGPGAFAIEPGTRAPWVAWARFDGEDHEIVVSLWDGEAWTSPEPLTSNTDDDLDPDVTFSADGTLHVTWWREGTVPRVYERRRLPDGTWTPEEPVTEEGAAGRLPAVAAASDGPRVGWQGAEGADTTIVVSARQPDGSWQAELVARTGYGGPAGDGDVDVQVHAVGGRMWVDWVDGPGVMAFSIRDPETGHWSAPETEPYDWDESAGGCEFHARELARQRVRWRVLGN